MDYESCMFFLCLTLKNEVLHAANGHVRVNLQTTSVPTEQGNPQYFVPGPVQSAVRVNKEQSRVQQPPNPQPTPIAKQTERKRPHRPSVTENGNGLSPTKISKVASTIDLGLTPERSESIRTDSHHDPTETEHKQNVNSSNTEYKLNDFLRIPSTARHGEHGVRAQRGDTSTLRVVTINSEGVIANRLFLEELCANNDIICLQEHWLWDFQKEWISQNFKKN